MGLDNGLMLKIKDKEKFGEIPSWIRREDWEDKYGYDYEINYWRKCWNVKDLIFDVLVEQGVPCHEDGSSFVMPLKVLDEINKELKKLYTEKIWDKGGSIWEWEDIRETYKNNLKYAKKVAKWLKRKPADSFEVYFYDSY